MHPAILTRSHSLAFFTLATRNTKRITLVLAALLWAAGASGFRFTSIDAPYASGGFAIATLAALREPSAYVLVALGFTGLAVMGRRRYLCCPALSGESAGQSTEFAEVEMATRRVGCAALGLVVRGRCIALAAFALALSGLAVATSHADILYVSNLGNNTIEKFTPGGIGSVFASTGLNGPSGLAFDSAGNLYVSNEPSNSIEKFTPGGVGSVFAGGSGTSGLTSPYGLAFDSAGNLYAANNTGNSIEKFNPGGVPSFFANLGLDGPAYLAFTDDAGVPLSLPPGSVTEPLAGDYNHNGVVDAADYVVWRANQGTANVLANDPIGGTIGTAQYNQWRAHFGQAAGSGAGAIANAAVPEPPTLVTLLVGVLAASARRRTLVA